MAIDTESKRRSAQMQASGTIRPVADGTIGAPDRAQCAWLYSGLTYSAPPAPSDAGNFVRLPINSGRGL